VGFKPYEDSTIQLTPIRQSLENIV